MHNTLYGREFLIALKATAGMPGPALVIPVGRPPVAFLRPVSTKKELLIAEDVRVLTEWRNRFVQAFLTEFQATESRTSRWLTDMVGPKEGKILFMVDDLNGRTFAYMGLDFIDWKHAYGEADAVVRGAEAAPGTMKLTLQTLMAWAQGQLGLRKLGVRVRSDNTAVKFYEKTGFSEIRRVPLRKVDTPEMVSWVEDKTLKEATVYLVHMRWRQGSQG